MEKSRQIDAIYPLSPMQQGMLFHTIYAPDSGVYFHQVRCVLEGELDAASLREAWQRVLDRHAILRTAFVWEHRKQPLQVVHPQVSLPWVEEDWRGLSSSARHEHVEAYLERDRQTGFVLSKAPLMRCALLRTADDAYEFIWSYHHILLDGWSLALLLKEVFAYYAALQKRERLELPRPRPYQDYIAWLKRQSLSDAESFWRNTLRGFTAPTPFALARSHANGAGTDDGEVQLALSSELTAALNSLAAQHKLTVNTMVQGGWALLLSRYSGEREVVYGATVSGRPADLPGIETMIGLFINTLPVRVSVSGDELLTDWLQAIQAHQVEARQFEFSPLVQIQGWSEVPRKLPLFESIYIFENYLGDALGVENFGNVRVRDIRPIAHTNYPLTLMVYQGQRLLLKLFYDSARFDHGVAVRTLDHLRTVLESMVANPQCRLSDVNVLTAPERERLIAESGEDDVVDHSTTCLHRLFEAQVEQTPLVPALVFEQTTLTYAELNSRANRLGHYLRALGVGPEVIVGVCLQRSVEMVVALLGILKAGGAYLPLDPAYPSQRLSFMVRDSKMHVLVTEPSLADKWDTEDIEFVYLEAGSDLLPEQRDDNPALEVSDQNLAYVIYTSGSTGTPKGVQIPRAAVSNLLLSMAQAPGLKRSDTLLAVTTLSFDIAALEIFLPLITGAQLVLASRETATDAAQLSSALERHNVTVMQATPATWRMLIESGWQPRASDGRGSAFAAPGNLGLKVFCGGEALGRALADSLLDRSKEVWNVYGPTETTIWSALWRVTAGDNVSIGKPIARTQLYVLDEQAQLVPEGVAGELYIGGAGLARGYRGRADLTAEKFLPNPYSAMAGSRMYRTGDLVRRLPNGDIEYIARVDNQVKVRGFRIELGEIEAVLEAHEAVSEAVVTVHEDARGDKRLVAYVVPDTEALPEQTSAQHAEVTSQWQSTWDETYSGGSTQTDPTFNLAGWNSSYTGAPIPPEEMRQWVDQTVARVLSLKPKRVLEIGCGTGLLLARIAPHCDQYCATDFSPNALTNVERICAARKLDHVKLFQRAADDFTGFGDKTFDTVIFNSVVQYFPDVNYLLRILERAARLVKPGGTIFLGDIRNLLSQEALHGSIQLQHASADVSVAQLRQRIQKSIAQEEELVIAPAFFYALRHHLPAIAHVQVRHKRGRYQNELWRFRYDVLLKIDDPVAPDREYTRLNWQRENLSVAQLESLLAAEQPDVLHLVEVPNARGESQQAIVDTLANMSPEENVSDLHTLLSSAPKGQGMEPEDFWALSESLPYLVEVIWNESTRTGFFEVVLKRTSNGSATSIDSAIAACLTSADKSKSWTSYANNPSRGKLASRLVPQLRKFVEEKLPSYMIPAAFVLLTEMPLTLNGKVDRRQLAQLELGAAINEENFIAPRTPTEELIAGVWQEVLDIERAGIDSDFFELGGHSLLAMQVISRLRDAFKLELPLRLLFGKPTIRELALGVEEEFKSGRKLDAPPIEILPRDEVLPLSFAQQRLWFLDQMEPGNPFYNLGGAVRLRGPLDIAALKRSFDEVLRRHEALRATFIGNGKEVRLVIAAEVESPLPIVDLEHFEPDQRETEIRRLAVEEAQKPFDLGHGPLLRTTLLRLTEQEHVVLFTMHHIVSDEWSIGLMIKEIGVFYEAFSRNTPALLPDLKVQYADFAGWQQRWLSDKTTNTLLDYWKKQLDGAPLVLDLPAEGARPPVQTYQGATYQFDLGAALTEKLKTASRQQGATLFMTLLAAFRTLLYRYTGQEDFVIGTPVANRSRQDLEPLIGFFVNLLVLRSQLNSETTFTDHLRRVRETALDAYAHQDLPFEKLVEELQPERDLSRSPVFQVLFALQNAPVDLLSPDLAGVEMSAMEIERGISRYDLGVSVMETNGSLYVAFEYNTQLFAASRMVRMAGHYVNLLESIVAEPQKKVGELELIGAEERRLLLSDFNQTARTYSRAACVHELVEQHAASRPTALALAYQDQQLTFGEWNERANRLAHYLRRLSVGPEVMVGICVERSLDWVVALLGILKAGGAYVALDPSYPADRLAYMLQDSNVPVLVTQERLLPLLSSPRAQVMCLDADAERFAAESDQNPPPLARAENLAYVTYTSGSTGKPKAVMTTHGSLLNLVFAHRRDFNVTEDDRSPQFGQMGFDASVWELWPYLTAGASVHLVDDETRLAPEKIRQWFVDKQITIGWLPPVLSETVLDNHWPEPLSLRLLITGSDKARRHPPLSLPFAYVNSYGPTETTVLVTWGAVPLKASSDIAPSIGRPIDNTQIYMLDRRLRPVPIGVPGELCIGGVSLGRGYLNWPDLTAEKFIPDAFGPTPGMRLYRTGDLARFNEEGAIEFLGRIDDQVKVRGFRIELGEIETVLAEHPDVRTALILVNEDSANDKRLIAYIVPQEQATNGDAEKHSYELTSRLAQHLREKLPAYMVPSAFVLLKEMPLSPNGKLNRRLLPAPDENGLIASESYVAPRTAIEQTVADIFKRVLKVEEAGIHDNFFELGGHSLLATQVVSQIREQFDLELSLRSFFGSPTVAGVAEIIEADPAVHSNTHDSQIKPVSRLRPLPLSFAQQRLWFLDRLDSGSTAYNVPLAVRLSGSLDVEVLKRTLNEVVRRHEILRTTLDEVDGEPRQIVSPPASVSVLLLDLCELGKAEQETALRRHLNEAMEQQFDLANGPLLKVELLKLADDEHVLILTMHHIITDGWSMGVLIDEVGALYEAFAAGLGSPLPELPIQYADYAIWQRERLQGEVMEQLLDYWRAQLGGAPSLELPTDHPRPARQSFRGARLAFELSAELTEKLRDLSQHEGVTLFMTLLSGWQTLLARYSGQWDISVGTPIANRTRSEVERLIGFFVNTLVLRTQMNANASFREQLQQVREVCLGAYAHQDVPFERVVEELQPERDLSRSPLFQVLFEMQNAPLGDLELPGLKLEPLAGELDTTKFDLTLTTMESETGLLVWCEYNTDLFEEPTVTRMIEHWRGLLEAAVAEPERSLAMLPLLTEAERRQLLAWNETAVAYPRDATIAELFAEQAARTPAKVAVEHDGERLTYAELNRRANRLAHHLRRFGVGPELRVGLSIDRSLELVIALLGVLKAGGAYVPLDRDYPLDRLRFMIEDAQLRVVLTKEPSAFAETGVHVIDLTAAAAEIGAESEAEPESGVAADNLAYVIYTSGSTGTPKGVEVDHRAVLRTVLNTDYIQVTPADRVAQAANTAFDASTFEVWATLLNGATSVVLDKEIVLGGEKLAAAIKWREISVLYLTAALFHHMAQVDAHAFAPLRAVLFGGETVDPRRVRAVLEAGSPERLLHMYGPTEVTVFSTGKMVTELATDASTVSIGRAIANTEVYVLDEWLELSPIGVNGELYHGGDGLARGYLNRPELTAQRFVPNPYARHAGERLYRTGDVVRYHADGELEFVGRRDAQVKVRGFRIELGEIETVLTQHPQVRQAVAVVREPEPENKQLVAYVTGEVEAAELRGYLKEKLPDYMAPQFIVILDSLPLTRVGKIDRQALPAPDTVLGSENYVGPRTAIEQTLVDIFKRVLKVEEVGVFDNFFELGGHSLLATQLVSRIREQFEVELPLRTFFISATVAELAEIVEPTAAALSGAQELPIKRVSRRRPLPLSFAQQGLWLTDQLDPGGTAYNVPLAARLSGSLDIAVLRRTLSEVVRRHEILRTTLVEIDGEPRQIIAPPAEVSLPLIDLSELGEAEREIALRRRMEDSAAERFDLARGPLLKLELLKMAHDEHVLILTMHHIITDGWSTGVFIDEVGALYEAFVAGRESPLPELPIQYADYAIWQRERLQGEVLEELLDYWRVQLAGAAPLELPADYSRTNEQSLRSESLPFTLTPELTTALKEISRREGVTLFMTLLACWQLLLARYTGREDIVVTSPIANRTQVGFEGLIGLFVNLVVLRTQVSSELSFLELLERVREVCFGAYAHQDLPFERLVQELQPERQSGQSPLFQVLFQLQNMPQQELKLSGLKLTTLPMILGPPKVDLTLTMAEVGDVLIGEFTYSQNLAADSILAMERQWRALLESVVADPDCPISALAMGTEQEYAQLIDSFNEQLEV